MEGSVGDSTQGLEQALISYIEKRGLRVSPGDWVYNRPGNSFVASGTVGQMLEMGNRLHYFAGIFRFYPAEREAGRFNIQPIDYPELLGNVTSPRHYILYHEGPNGEERDERTYLVVACEQLQTTGTA